MRKKFIRRYVIFLEIVTIQNECKTNSLIIFDECCLLQNQDIIKELEEDFVHI